MAVKETKMRGKRVSVHARSCESIKMALRHGAEVIYHASYADEEALDMLEAQKHRIFVAPGLSVIVKLLYEGEPYGFSPQRARELGYEDELEAASTQPHGHASARHPRASRRRLRLRLGAALDQCDGPAVLRQVLSA